MTRGAGGRPKVVVIGSGFGGFFAARKLDMVLAQALPGTLTTGRVVDDSLLDGQGFDVARSNGGSGLQNIRDRVDALEGTFAIHTGSAGTSLEGSIPLATSG